MLYLRTDFGFQDGVKKGIRCKPGTVSAAVNTRSQPHYVTVQL